MSVLNVATGNATELSEEVMYLSQWNETSLRVFNDMAERAFNEMSDLELMIVVLQISDEVREEIVANYETLKNFYENWYLSNWLSHSPQDLCNYDVMVPPSMNKRQVVQELRLEQLRLFYSNRENDRLFQLPAEVRKIVIDSIVTQDKYAEPIYAEGVLGSNSARMRYHKLQDCTIDWPCGKDVAASFCRDDLYMLYLDFF